MAYDRRPNDSTQSYRTARDTPTSQYPSYRRPYAETVSDHQSTAPAGHAHPPTRSVSMEQHRAQASSYTLRSEYPRAPPPASHRSDISIGTNSYLDYDTEMLDSNSIADAVSVHSSISQRSGRRSPRQDESIFQSVRRRLEEPAPEEYYREYQNRVHLRPTPVRQQRTFSYEQDVVDRSREPGHTPHQDERPHLRTRPGTYREIPPAHYGMILSEPFDWDDSYRPQPGPPTRYHPEGSREHFAHAYSYEPGRAYKQPSPPPSDASMHVKAPSKPPTSRRHGESALAASRAHTRPQIYGERTRRDHDPSSRAHSSASRSGTMTNLRQYRERGEQVVEVRTPSGTTIRIVEESGSS